MLLSRVLSALVLAPVAIAAVYYGAWPFLSFWIVAAVVVLWEWTRLVGGVTRPGWAVLGLAYAASLLIAPVLLRHDQSYGMAAIFILFAIVWTTDIAGYFAGRAIGGPKLAPAVSPKKTWSGAIAGLIGAGIIVAVGAHFIAGTRVAPLVVLAIVLSVASQAGDLAESALKRRFDVKDVSQIIPGHGGVMDRLDGFWAAVICAVVIGVVRGGFSEPAKGLLVW
jgi:phosphatidate cytidylyltransferase